MGNFIPAILGILSPALTITEYKEKGLHLTNKTEGNIGGISFEEISQVKYLTRLVKAGVLKMSQDTIAQETETYHVLVNTIFNLDINDKTNKYNRVQEKCPDNIDYILDTYHADLLSDRDIKFGNIKYVLNLLEKKIIKTNQQEIANFFDESTTVISGIKKINIKI